MKCMLNDTEVFNLSETQTKLLYHVMASEKVEPHVQELLKWAVGKYLHECAVQLFREWKPKLAQEGVESIPLADEKLAELIFNHKDYAPSLNKTESS